MLGENAAPGILSRAGKGFPMNLSELSAGQTGVITGYIKSSSMRRRLQDLGLVPGTEIECLGKSPLGDPAAYFIRRTVIALRREDASQVEISVRKEQKKHETTKVIALAGNPNVGKSTVFNELTGRNQHTGNWPGKTVESARGICRRRETLFQIVDLPGCYSLLSHSEEEEIARDYICFEHPDAVLAVCDASCMERNLNLALQILETTPRVILGINLMDEAEKKQIHVDLDSLSGELGIPVIGMTARSGQGLEQIFEAAAVLDQTGGGKRALVRYSDPMEKAIEALEPVIREWLGDTVDARWASVRILTGDESFKRAMEIRGKAMPEIVKTVWKEETDRLSRTGIGQDELQDETAEAFIRKAEKLCEKTVTYENRQYADRDRLLDRLFTSRYTGFPIMFLLLLLVFWITVSGANYPSSLLFGLLFRGEDLLIRLASLSNLPEWISDPLIFGVYRTAAWVVSVMLPPMAIFFPLFTILEDFGYLPRAAFNLDRCFKKCHACGKQALTMCMGFGCNAAAVTGCRIIDSPRERMIAILTNSLVPCNGRFPTILTLISLFLTGTAAGAAGSFLSALLLAAVILLGICMTLLASRLLSETILKGIPSSFALELPPYRRPLIRKVLVRSVFDRTLFVLRRAIAVAAPSGLLLWLAANIRIGGYPVFYWCTEALDPFAVMLGMDGVILLAFILGMAANEIVLPVMLMMYLSQDNLQQFHEMSAVFRILTENGWTWITAVCTILFSLMHWPCGTACATIYRETGSLRWTLVAILLPAGMGVSACFFFASAARMLTGGF